VRAALLTAALWLLALPALAAQEGGDAAAVHPPIRKACAKGWVDVLVTNPRTGRQSYRCETCPPGATAELIKDAVTGQEALKCIHTGGPRP
jgi:hypothetical protein